MAAVKRVNKEDPMDWSGTRKVRHMNIKCGWCMDGDHFKTEKFHESCIQEIGYFETLIVCPCDCNADWVPQAVTVERGGEVVGSMEVPLPRPVVAEPEPKPSRSGTKKPTDE